MGALCGCKSNNFDDERQYTTLNQTNYGEGAGHLGTTGHPHPLVDDQSDTSSMSLSAAKIENSDEWIEYCSLMRTAFYCFAGHQPWAKMTGLYLHKADLQVFLDIVNIQDDVDTVLKQIDTDIEDGRITINEWMDWFTSKEDNPDVFALREHIESQVTWTLLKSALKIFETTDENHSGKLEYSDFTHFGATIGLNDQEIECLFNTLDTDEDGGINIVELFEWFRLRLYQQSGRAHSQRMATLNISKADLKDLREFRYAAKSMTVDSNNSSKTVNSMGVVVDRTIQ